MGQMAATSWAIYICRKTKEKTKNFDMCNFYWIVKHKEKTLTLMMGNLDGVSPWPRPHTMFKTPKCSPLSTWPSRQRGHYMSTTLIKGLFIDVCTEVRKLTTDGDTIRAEGADLNTGHLPAGSCRQAGAPATRGPEGGAQPLSSHPPSPSHTRTFPAHTGEQPWPGSPWGRRADKEGSGYAGA